MASRMVRTHVALPSDLVGEIDQVAGPRQRSEFIAEAAREKLKRLRLQRAAASVGGSLEQVDIPGWETSESTSAWVRATRRTSDTRLTHPDAIPNPDAGT